MKNDETLDIYEPPGDKSRAKFWALVGLGLNALALILNFIADTTEATLIARAAALALFAGTFLTGCGVSIRASWFVVWLIAGAAALLGMFAVPRYLESMVILYRGFLLVSVVTALIVAFPGWPRRVICGALISFHFFGIWMAILSPPPSPWIVFQVWQRYVCWWFDPIYINNAYQFYAPDPGPANQLWFCLEYRKEGDIEGETQEEKNRRLYSKELNADFSTEKLTRWIKLPTRPGDMKDPLAISYYRRSALAEYTSQTANTGTTPYPSESREIERRRLSKRNEIPLHSSLAYPQMQYRVPSPLVADMIVPSYAKHITASYKDSEPGWQYHSVRIYRVLHMIVEPDVFAQKERPVKSYDPSTYQPYFLGEFLADGSLKDPNDPLLYWVIPIERKREGKPRKFTDTDYYDNYYDYLRIHSNSDHTK
jgi:hypothetical protein